MIPCRRCQAFPTHTEIPVPGQGRTRHHLRCPAGHDWAIAERLEQAVDIWRRAQLGEDRRGTGVAVVA